MKYIDYQRHIPADICVVRTPRYTYRIESVPGMTAIVRKDRLNVNSVHIHLTDIVRIAEGRFDEYQIPEKGWIYSDRAKDLITAVRTSNPDLLLRYGKIPEWAGREVRISYKQYGIDKYISK